MNTSIRPATAADAAAICEIYNHYVLTTTISFEMEAVSTPEMAQRIAEVSAQFPWLVYEENGRILGYAYAAKWKVRKAYQHSVESSVYLARDSGGKGIGSQLYEALFAELKARSVHAVMGGIAQPNPGSVALHEKMGFVKVAHFAQVGRKFDQWIDVAYWQLIL
ncbi:arsinothricin resistance N-acetyltransferase ArsN1 family B [Herbaspirillum sp. RV1423]|uniref:arsinothricin resistance N-acetyltransferase ArsN1 family B n=1 Tax=Herbaspirillum sp. RV1423 TaxID=1443993 RepID=UPI0004B9D202|nr:arsinothricin resistance N-acetyltransferase ArsN1 family B [Herbaspirillum sp. RV1423]